MSDVEQVLVLPRAVFDQIGAFQGVCFDLDRYLDAFFAPGTLRFMPRPQAEEDPGFKQIIPYVIFAHQGRCFSYVRGKRAGEKRLVGNRSIGIGGHINPADDMPLFSSDFRDAYRAAVDREVAEEVIVGAGYSDRIVGLINDDATEVGRVHLGIIHYRELDAPAVRKREQVITQQGFLTVAELQAARETLESWSALCLDHLDALAGSAAQAAR